ncbi:DUF6912 family protein [Cellulosimicrobium composti]|uniref:DUF6912 family protein n=1 Tax=Cellulosimicrobium composti TaxID=2672572 RepID=UPI0004675637|nr:hypothetical protein L603_000100000960 [Cellulosimicrobium cellulans J34]SME96787.1 hypothetical protein SAMN02744115_00614 [Cellulosimicrobium cellulans J1]
MRIYLPATLDELDAVTVTADAARWTVAPRGAHAVTAALTRALPDEDEEGLEYAAALEAADDSLALVASRPDAPRQRLVVTVEVPDGAVQVVGGADDDEDAPAPSAVEVLRTVPDVAIVCVHVDEPEAVPDVEAVLAAADGDGPEADAALDAAIERVGERDLLWYDWSELKDVPRG